MKNALVIGVILLFLGVGIQPALANEVFSTIISDAEEDCGCQPINRAELLRVKLLLIRLEVFTNIILSKFSHIPEIQEKCGEISNGVTTLRERINGLNPDLPLENEPIICYILIILIIQIGLLIEFMFYLGQLFPILDNILSFIGNELIGELIFLPIVKLFAELCWPES